MTKERKFYHKMAFALATSENLSQMPPYWAVEWIKKIQKKIFDKSQNDIKYIVNLIFTKLIPLSHLFRDLYINVLLFIISQIFFKL